IRDCVSETVTCSSGAPQGTVLSPFLFTIYTSDFRYDSETCHMQKFSDDTAIVARVVDGQEDEYRGLVNDFCDWSTRNHLQLNVGKTREMVVDFRRKKAQLTLVSILGLDVEVVQSYKYLGVHLDNRLEWSGDDLSMGYMHILGRVHMDRALSSWWEDISYEKGTEYLSLTLRINKGLQPPAGYHLSQVQTKETAKILSSLSTAYAHYANTSWDWILQCSIIRYRLILLCTTFQC
ncbi:hypothetical protein AAFF_G00011550, partial [Aldrovandia affinis]